MRYKARINTIEELFNIVDYRLDVVNEEIQRLYDIEGERCLLDYEEIGLQESFAVRQELIYIRDKIKEIMNRESEEE